MDTYPRASIVQRSVKKGNLSILLPKIPIDKEQHQPALNLADAKRWWEELNNRDGAGARALALVALTASRSVEVRGMKWGTLTKQKPSN